LRVKQQVTTSKKGLRLPLQASRRRQKPAAIMSLRLVALVNGLVRAPTPHKVAPAKRQGKSLSRTNPKRMSWRHQPQRQRPCQPSPNPLLAAQSLLAPMVCPWSHPRPANLTPHFQTALPLRFCRRGNCLFGGMTSAQLQNEIKPKANCNDRRPNGVIPAAVQRSETKSGDLFVSGAQCPQVPRSARRYATFVGDDTPVFQALKKIELTYPPRVSSPPKCSAAKRRAGTSLSFAHNSDEVPDLHFAALRLSGMTQLYFKR
jgi:hypothetical protein